MNGNPNLFHYFILKSLSEYPNRDINAFSEEIRYFFPSDQNTREPYFYYDSDNEIKKISYMREITVYCRLNVYCLNNNHDIVKYVETMIIWTSFQEKKIS